MQVTIPKQCAIKVFIQRAGDGTRVRNLMKLKTRGSSIRLMIGLLAACLAGTAGAQESLDRGKNAAQLFASHCSTCHKSPQAVAKSGGLFGLEGFLREHYTTSRETASAMANYLRAMDPGRAARRAAKSGDRARLDEKKKPAARSGEVRGAEPGSARAKSAEPRPPADIVAPERKSTQ
jgi:mono/diheme cytochrome c family protein